MVRAAGFDDHTETATVLGSRGHSGGSAPEAGLVLLYAAEPHEIPPVSLLDGETCIIGRGPASLVVAHPTVSRMHARVTRTPEGFLLRDLGSHNGVLVGGRPIVETVLRANDEVRIGEVIFKFVERDARAYADYFIDGRVRGEAPRVTIPGAVGGLQMARLSAQIEQVGPSDLNVLVLGETGSGKELVARAVHEASGRKGPFRAINCAAIPANLVESELFGFKRGAFSGANRDHAGIIRASEGGTLLLDEIGDMPLEVQAKLLRTLETREVVPVGSVTGERVDVRIVSATHRDLRTLAEKGAFRGDLFARLNAYTLVAPPLRERKEDLYMLVRHFAAAAGDSRPPTFRFMVSVCHYPWPYNVRELVAAVKRAVTVSRGEVLEADDLPEPIVSYMRDYGEPTSRALATDASTHSKRPSREDLVALLRENGGNVAAVARALGKDRAQIHRWLRYFDLDPNGFR